MKAEKDSSRVLQGVVVSDKMTKSIVVRVERRVKHPLYKKIITRSKKIMAHDEKGVAREGDKVNIQEYRPLSKTKSWVLLDVVETTKER